MPVTNTVPHVEYLANGTVNVFAYPFRILSSADLRIFINDHLLTTGFVVTGVRNTGGGTVTITPAPANGDVVKIIRDVRLDRSTDYISGGPLAERTLDDDLDRIVMQVQDLRATTVNVTPSWSSGVISTVEGLQAELDAIRTVGVGFPVVSVLPGTGTDGDIVSLTTDGKLYRWFEGAWTAAVSTVDLTGVITVDQIDDDAITAAKIAAGTITAAELAAGAVTNVNIAPLTITSDSLAPLAISADKIQSAAITADKIAANAITAGQLATNSVTASKISAGSITATKIAELAVDATKIAAGSIGADHIVASAITAAKIATNSVTSDKIAANSITSGHIAALTITAGDIAANAIESDKIMANSISASKIVSGAIDSDKIAANAITTSKIAALAVYADKIAANTITGAKIAASTITGAKIAAGTITASNIAAGTITASNIAAGTITADRIAAGTITAAKIAAGTLTADKLDISYLSSVSSSTGSLLINAGGHIRLGQTAFNTGSGFWIGDSGGVAKLSIGSASGNNLTWDGTSLQVTGNVQKAPITYTVGSSTTYYTNNAQVSVGTTQIGANSATVKTWVASSTQVYTVNYNLWRNSSTTGCIPETVTAYLYVNGVLKATRSTSSTSAVSFSDSVGLVSTGSTITLVLYRYTSSWPASCLITAYNSTFNITGGTEKVFASAPGDTMVYGTTYYPVKQIKIPYAGTVKTRFQLLNNSTSIYGRIYKNGTAVGTERVHSAVGYSDVYEQNFTVASGDLLQLYCKQGGAYMSADWATMFQLLSLNTNTAEYPEIF